MRWDTELPAILAAMLLGCALAGCTTVKQVDDTFGTPPCVGTCLVPFIWCAGMSR